MFSTESVAPLILAHVDHDVAFVWPMRTLTWR
jgi:hypothetical protein